MFSKTNKDDAHSAQNQNQNQPKRTMRSAPSIISMDLTVTGSMSAGGDIQVDGKVDGDIQAGSLTIGEKAVVQGEIYAEEVVVRGKVKGSIRARKVQLCSTSHVEGDIYHQALAVETGAYFEGNCRHSDDPLKEGKKGSSSGERKIGQGPAPRPDTSDAKAPGANVILAAPSGGPTLPPSRLSGGLLGRPSPVQVGRGRPEDAPEAAAGKGK